MDSLGIIEMISAVEQHFEITVDFEPMDPEELTLLDKVRAFRKASRPGHPKLVPWPRSICGES